MTKLLMLFAVIMMLSGCKATKSSPASAMAIETNTKTAIIHTESIDTVYIEIPAQSAERTATEKTSHLETDYAESDARINEDGTLSHRLKNKPTKHPVPVKNSTDTIYVDKTIETPVPVNIPVEVERDLTWWENMQLKTWAWLAVSVVVMACWHFKKPLIAIIRKIINR